MCRRRRQAVVQQYDSSTEEETSDGSDGKEEQDDDDHDDPTKPTSSRRRPPARSLNGTTHPSNSHNARPNSQANPRGKARIKHSSHTNNTNTAAGSSIPSYEDGSPRSPSYFPPYASATNTYFPPPPSTRRDHRHHQKQSHPPPVAKRRPHRPRTNTVPPNLDRSSTGSSAITTSTPSSTDSSNSSSSGGLPLWQPHRVPLKRSKTARQPARAPVQAVVPRAPRNVAAAHSDVDDYDEVEDVVRGMSMIPPAVEAPRKKLVAGGKKAALAVELKLNLEIELELKAYIYGDVTLELFN